MSRAVQMIKNLPAMRETWDQSLGQGRSPGEGNGNPLQYSFLGILWTEGPEGLQSMALQRKSWTQLSN